MENSVYFFFNSYVFCFAVVPNPGFSHVHSKMTLSKIKAINTNWWKKISPQWFAFQLYSPSPFNMFYGSNYLCSLLQLTWVFYFFKYILLGHLLFKYLKFSVFFFCNLPAYNYMRGRSHESKFFIWSMENNITHWSHLQVPI